MNYKVLISISHIWPRQKEPKISTHDLEMSTLCHKIKLYSNQQIVKQNLIPMTLIDCYKTMISCK
jgi:hypothetical protein